MFVTSLSPFAYGACTQFPGKRWVRTRIVVAGAGYVGLTGALCLAQLGHTVACYDPDRERISTLQAGTIPLREPGLQRLLDAAPGRVTFATRLPDGPVDADAVLLCVGTPARPDGSCDLSFLEQAVADLAPRLPPGQLVITRSTVPPGTNRRLQGAFGERARVVACPEFLREGSAVADFLRPDRMVFGAAGPEDAEPAAAIFAGLPGKRLVTTWEAAEIIKYASNAFLAVRVSFANELAGLCAHFGADPAAVMYGIGLDPRIGTGYLSPGAGYGGSCLPKDVGALLHTAGTAGCQLRVVQAAAQVNDEQPRRLVQRLAEAAGGLAGQPVALWGLAFKAGTDDLRASPALRLLAALREADATVRAHDPAAMEAAARLEQAPLLAASPLEAARGAYALVIATEWPEYEGADLQATRAVMSGPWLLDCRNVIDPGAARRAGFHYLGVGR